jgi:hypothetical protein
VTMTLDLTNPKQRRQAEHGVAEKISVEIIPHLFHDPERKAWIRLPIDDHYETYAVDSEEIADFLKQLVRTTTDTAVSSVLLAANHGGGKTGSGGSGFFSGRAGCGVEI